MKAYVKTYGCQMNEQDSLQMQGILSKMGYSITEESLNADLILIVTCSIREKSVHKVYSELGKLRPHAENHPELLIALSGCVAQQEKGELLKRFPYLDMVFGPDAIPQLPEMLAQAQKNKRGGQRILETRLHSRKDFDFVNLINKDSEENRVKAFVNIQKGCDNVCAFCIVPYVRGREVSRPSQDIIKEIRELVAMGVKEVTLLGQNVNSYGLKDSHELSFAQLLEKIIQETHIERLRFVTSHPKDVHQDLIEVFRNYEALSPHFHLPVQSGSNKVLEVMRRQYTREDYLDKIYRLKKARPDITFSSDFIIGFPSEDDKDFQDSLQLLEEVSFDHSYSFIYSPRPYTTAVKLEDNVPLEIKKERLQIFQKKQSEICSQKHQALVGSQTQILIEKWDSLIEQWLGRSDTNKIVHTKSASDKIPENPENFIGQTRPVTIVRGNPHSLMATMAC